MPKIFKISYDVYYTAVDLERANQFGLLYGNQFTNIMRKNTFVIDTTSVAIPSGTAIEVTKEEHSQALEYCPPENVLNGLSDSLVKFLSTKE